MKKTLADFSFVNGRLTDKLSAADRGLHYGDGLFETILVLDGNLILEKEHLERLFRDAVRLSININHVQLRSELRKVVGLISDSTLNKTGVLKIIVTRQSSGRGYSFDKSAGSNRLLQYYSGVTYPSVNREGVRIGLTDCRLPDEPSLAGIKHLNRLNQVLAQTKVRKPFYQEGVVCGSHGEILEGTFSNLFIVKDNKIYTPKLNKAGVRGVMRDYIFRDVCDTLKLTSIETTISLDNVLLANEVFICNSVFGVWPVNAIDVKNYTAGSVTLAIQNQVDMLGYKKLYS